MTKMFKDSMSASREPARLLGTVDGFECYESTSIYMTHLVRMEKGSSVKFMYDPGKVWRTSKFNNTLP